MMPLGTTISLATDLPWRRSRGCQPDPLSSGTRANIGDFQHDSPVAWRRRAEVAMVSQNIQKV